MLVVISDGEDNLSDHALSEAIEAAIRAEACIYAISTNTDWLSLSGDDASQDTSWKRGDKDSRAIRGPDRRARLLSL